MIIDLDLSNEELYEGCDIQIVPNGSRTPRRQLVTPTQEAVEKVLRNLQRMLEKELLHAEVVLTGSTKLEIYLAVCAYMTTLCTTIIHQKGKQKTKIK